MIKTVTIQIYGPNEDQPKFEGQLHDYDPRRDENKIYQIDLPGGDRIFVTIDETN